MSFKNKNIIRQFPYFTHFACLPFLNQQYRDYIQKVQALVEGSMREQQFEVQNLLKRHSHLLSHVTMIMLTLMKESGKKKIKQFLEKQKQTIQSKLKNLQITPEQVKYFTRLNKNQKCQQVTVIYMSIDERSTLILSQFVDYLVRLLLSHQIIQNQELKAMRVNYDHKLGKFYPETFHISLFRCRNLLQKQKFTDSLKQINSILKEQSKTNIRKFKCDFLDISTMMQFDTNKFYLPLERIDLNPDLQIMGLNEKMQSVFQNNNKKMYQNGNQLTQAKQHNEI